MKHSKGNTMAIAVLLILALAFTGCGWKITKKTPVDESPAVAAQADDTITIKMGKNRTNMVILEELIARGEVIDKDVYSHSWLVWSAKEQKYVEVNYNWEMWVIQTGKDFHAAIFEFGRLVDIEPVKDLEEARSKFKPYGGWNRGN